MWKWFLQTTVWANCGTIKEWTILSTFSSIFDDWIASWAKSSFWNKTFLMARESYFNFFVNFDPDVSRSITFVQGTFEKTYQIIIFWKCYEFDAQNLLPTRLSFWFHHVSKSVLARIRFQSWKTKNPRFSSTSVLKNPIQ